MYPQFINDVFIYSYDRDTYIFLAPLSSNESLTISALFKTLNSMLVYTNKDSGSCPSKVALRDLQITQSLGNCDSLSLLTVSTYTLMLGFWDMENFQPPQTIGGGELNPHYTMGSSKCYVHPFLEKGLACAHDNRPFTAWAQCPTLKSSTPSTS